MRNATRSNAVPVKANTPAKKNAHRAPPLGVVYVNRRYKPPQPRIMKRIADVKKVLTGGEVCVSI